MPLGIPEEVATVAINGAKNAGILAAQILREEVRNFARSCEPTKENEKDVWQKQKFEEIGYEKYLEGKDAQKNCLTKLLEVDIDTANETKREMVEILGGGNERVRQQSRCPSSLFDGAFPEYKTSGSCFKNGRTRNKTKTGVEHNSVNDFCYDLALGI